GCFSTCEVTILEPGAMECEIFVNQDVTCFDGVDGSATVSGIGGTAPYSYEWPDGSTDATNDNLSAGTYEVTVTDAFGYKSFCSVEIDEPTKLECTISVNSHVTCFDGSNGSATVSVTGGIESYSYLWPDNSTSATNS